MCFIFPFFTPSHASHITSFFLPVIASPPCPPPVFALAAISLIFSHYVSFISRFVPSRALPLPPILILLLFSPLSSPLLSSLLAVFLWELVGGCGGPSWVIVCFDVLVQIEIEAQGPGHWECDAGKKKKAPKRTGIDTFGHRKDRTEWQTKGEEEVKRRGGGVWVMAHFTTAGFLPPGQPSGPLVWMN